MHVTVAIVGFRNSDDVVRCVAALAQCNYPDFDIVICENGGEGAYSVLREVLPSRLPGGQGVRPILAPGNGGFASGVNLCIAASRNSDAWWVLNPDTEPSTGALNALVERLADNCDAVGGPLYLPNGLVQSYGGIWRGWLARSVSIGHGTPVGTKIDSPAVERAQNYLNGASMLVSCSFLNTAGLMREDFFLYCEEIDWFLRAKKRGMRLGFAPDALVLHHQGTTTGNRGDLVGRSRLAVYLDERNKMLLVRDHFPLKMPVAAIAAFGLICLRYLRKGAWRQFCYGVSGWLAGLLGERGRLSWMS